MELFVGILIGVATSYWTLVGLFILAVIADYRDNNIRSIFLVLAAAVVSYLVFGYSLWNIPLYLAVGVFWSIWRWKFFCKKVVEKANQGSYRASSGRWVEALTDKTKIKEQVLKDLELTENSNRLVAWMINWPVSSLVYLCRDIVDILKSFATKTLAGVYNRLSHKAIKDLK